MVTPTIYGISATPMALADEKGNAVDHRHDRQPLDGAPRALDHRRHGLTAMIALYPMTGRQLKEAMVPRHARARRGARPARPRDARGARRPVAAVVERLGGRRLFTRQGHRRRAPHRGGLHARRGAASRASATTRASARAPIPERAPRRAPRRRGRLPSLPDLIIVLDPDTGEPTTTEDLRYGFRVRDRRAVRPRWRTEEGLGSLGPRYFGYDFDFVPVEERLP